MDDQALIISVTVKPETLANLPAEFLKDWLVETARIATALRDGRTSTKSA